MDLQFDEQETSAERELRLHDAQRNAQGEGEAWARSAALLTRLETLEEDLGRERARALTAEELLGGIREASQEGLVAAVVAAERGHVEAESLRLELFQLEATEAMLDILRALVFRL